MRNIFRSLIVFALTAVLLATAVSAMTVDEQKGIQYVLWDSTEAIQNSASTKNAHNQLKAIYETFEAGGGAALCFDGSSGAYGPYYSFAEESLGEYRYAKIRYYYDAGSDDSQSTLTFQYYFQGGRCSLTFEMENYQWTDKVIAFKKGAEGFTGKEWGADASVKQFRLQLGLPTNSAEKIYISYIAFFKTQEEAEKFEGFVDASEYRSYEYGYNNLMLERYINTEPVKQFLETHSVDGYVYADQQAEVDALTAQLRELYDKIEYKVEPMPEQYIPASKTLTVLDSKTYSAEDPANNPPAEAETPAATETEAETPAGAETEAETPAVTETEAETPAGAETEAETPAATETEAETPAGTETEAETPAATETEAETPAGAETEAETPAATETEAETPAETPATSDPGEEEEGSSMTGIIVGVLAGIIVIVAGIVVIKKQKKA